MSPPAPADLSEPDCQPHGPARRRSLSRLASGLLPAALCLACSAPLVPVFTISGDAPSRTGLTPLGDGAVFGNDAGRVIRLDGAGRVLWTVETGAEIELPLVVSDDGVVGAISGGDTLVALDAATGHERWRAGGQPPVAALAGVGTRLVLLGKEGELRSFPAGAGGLPSRRGWNASLGLRGRSPPRGLVALERAVLAIGPAAVLLLSAEDGALRWKAPARDPTGAVLEADALWIAEQSGRLLVLDPRTGAQRRVVSLGPRAIPRRPPPRWDGLGWGWRTTRWWEWTPTARNPRGVRRFPRRCSAAWRSGRIGSWSPLPVARAASSQSTSLAPARPRQPAWTARSAPGPWSEETWRGCSPPTDACSDSVSAEPGRWRALRA